MDFQLDMFKKANILIIGDIMLDQYIWGEVARISPEAPVPVVRVLEKTDVLGGAGNVASNLAGLECGVLVKRFKDELGEDLDAISIGPTITNPHTTSESLQVEKTDGTKTVQQFYDAVSQILQKIFPKP